MMKSIVSLLISILAITSCGVKGDPIPPSKPIEIDDGNPFKDQHYEDTGTGMTITTAAPSPTPKVKNKKQKKGKKK